MSTTRPRPNQTLSLQPLVLLPALLAVERQRAPPLLQSVLSHVRIAEQVQHPCGDVTTSGTISAMPVVRVSHLCLCSFHTIITPCTHDCAFSHCVAIVSRTLPGPGANWRRRYHAMSPFIPFHSRRPSVIHLPCHFFSDDLSSDIWPAAWSVDVMLTLPCHQSRTLTLGHSLGNLRIISFQMISYQMTWPSDYYSHRLSILSPFSLIAPWQFTSMPWIMSYSIHRASVFSSQSLTFSGRSLPLQVCISNCMVLIVPTR